LADLVEPIRGRKPSQREEWSFGFSKGGAEEKTERYCAKIQGCLPRREKGSCMGIEE